jgi:hypothetical protein
MNPYGLTADGTLIAYAITLLPLMFLTIYNIISPELDKEEETPEDYYDDMPRRKKRKYTLRR